MFSKNLEPETETGRDENRLDFQVTKVANCDGYSVEWQDSKQFILAKGNKLFRLDRNSGSRSFIGLVPQPRWKTVACTFRPLQRALRFVFYNVLPLSDDRFFISFGRTIGFLSNGAFEEIQGVDRQFRILRGSMAESDEGAIFFGEYFGNAEREPVRIYRIAPGSIIAEVVHTFSAGTVRHIHGVYRDPHSKSLWCLTGDKDHECVLWTTDDDFHSVERFGGGDESWRAVSILFDEAHITYGMDAEFEQNYIYRIRRSDKVREKLGSIPGPVYYSFQIRDWCFFVVTAELCPSQSDRASSIWSVSPEGVLSEVARGEKDWLSPKYFMPGIFHPSLPREHKSEVFLSGIGLKGVDNKVLRIGFKA